MEPRDPLDTLVVGAGVSGLAYAHARARAGASVLVLEATPRVGGRMRTVVEDGFRFEHGPEALPGKAPRLRALCAELGLALHEAPEEARRRYLLCDGELRALPESAEELSTSRVLPFGAKLRLLAEPTCARGEALDGSVADFAIHRFGREALERVVEPLVAALHAGLPEELSVRACFPDVVRMVEEHGSIAAALKARGEAKRRATFGAPPPRRASPLVRPVGGMEALCVALARALGPRVRTSTHVVRIERGPRGWSVHAADGASFAAARVVLAVPLEAARTLLAAAAPEAAAELASMRSQDLAAVVHAHRRADVAHPLDAHGYLVPRAAGGIELGTVFCSTLEPGVAPAGHVLLRTLVGGARRPDALALDDGELVRRVHAECAGPLGLAREPVLARVSRYPAAIPRLDLAHPERLAALARVLPAGLDVLGDFTRGPDVERLVADALDAAASG